MPTIEELAQYQFEDFAMENSRRTPLTVLGEHAFGMEQGRIVTGLEATAAPAGGGTDVPETQPKTPPCSAPFLAVYIATTLRGKCGYMRSAHHTHGYFDFAHGCSFGAYEDCYTWEGPSTGAFYLTRVTTISGASPTEAEGSCPDTGSVGSGTITYTDVLDPDGCGPADGTSCSGSVHFAGYTEPGNPDVGGHDVDCSGHFLGLDCVIGEVTFSEEFTDSLLWDTLAANPPTPTVDPTIGGDIGDLEVEVHQQFIPNELSSQAGDEGYTEIDVWQANWCAVVPESYTGNYMKVWIYKAIGNYNDLGEFVDGTDELYATYEWDRSTAIDNKFNPVELLAADIIEGNNQHIRIYIKDSTCTRGLNCDVPYTGDPSNPYGDKRCIPAGGF